VNITGALISGNTFKTTSQSTTYTASAGDFILADASGGAFTITLPAATSNTDAIIAIKKIDSSGLAVTIDGNGSETIDGDLIKIISDQYVTLTLISDGSNWNIW